MLARYKERHQVLRGFAEARNRAQGHAREDCAIDCLVDGGRSRTPEESNGLLMDGVLGKKAGGECLRVCHGWGGQR